MTAVTAETHAAIREVWRFEAPKLIATLTRLVRDVGIAEELAQDALVAALESWPETGIPVKPAAWLVTTAKRRALNVLGHNKIADRKHEQLAQEHEVPDLATELEARLDDDVGDDLLRLMFISCHPVLSSEARAALTLRLLGGLTTEEIARAFLAPEPTIAQRIVRAKRTLADAKIPFEVPRGADRAERLASVLEVIYLIFNEGYAASAGDDAVRPALCDDALRLGRVLAGLAPDEPEVHGLVALMELHASRAGARRGPSGEHVLLLEQDRRRWDIGMIRRGLDALAKADGLGGAGTYVLQAKISACHARATTAAETDWAEIAAIYAQLVALTRSPVVELNRAMAVAMADGPAAGLAILDAIAGEPSLATYPWLPSARADLLAKLGRNAEAKAEYERAAELTRNTRDRALLLERAALLA
ncbi:MAG: RNA polymerase subunit sigma-24 [Kofleriaceae bacterium]|nr:RNA polymerase subunit sigma-24 [Kofleriaceae bacterium]